ncbi:hypothetical protein [Serratia sp. P2ACOL2]|uniref:hypothetical protein n=1 Tax=Serratia sp. P2ACOL2 TaxID=2482769 RepID=UPI000EFBFF42|nr:hypothetical protein [Serratia sp. P2ACOL2]AYO37216.1 hypothetical protein EBA31_07855 [Serratia sp. P2ACOL2]
MWAKKIKDEIFHGVLCNKLTMDLGDKSVSSVLAGHLDATIFDNHPPYGSIGDTSIIIAFAFGNRENVTGSKNELAQPGPMNNDLADCCARVYRMKPMRMYVQWEIARYLSSKEMYPDIPAEDIVSIEPEWDGQGNLTYLSTDGVLQAIINKYFGGNPAAVGTAAVIGHGDHVKRCVMTCQMRNVKGYALKEVTLPVWYDNQSSQAWTRRRDLYVLNDMANRLMMVAQKNINTQ